MRRLLASSRPHAGALVAGTVLALLAGVAGLLQPLLAKEVIDALSAVVRLMRSPGEAWSSSSTRSRTSRSASRVRTSSTTRSAVRPST